MILVSEGRFGDLLPVKVESTITLRFSFAILQGYSLKSARVQRNFAYHVQTFSMSGYYRI